MFLEEKTMKPSSTQKEQLDRGIIFWLFKTKTNLRFKLTTSPINITEMFHSRTPTGLNSSVLLMTIGRNTD